MQVFFCDVFITDHLQPEGDLCACVNNSKHSKPSIIIIIIIIIISLFQEDNIFGTNASLTYGPQLQR